MSVAVSSTPVRTVAPDHRLESWLFPTLQGWPRAVTLYFYYLVIIVALLWIYGWGDFTTAPFIYQGF